jgi:hypothetical protein
MSDENSKKASAFIEKLFSGFPDYQRRRLMQSHCLQSPEEKKARVKLVQELSAELAEIRKTERFILFGETAIEAVIEGDWKQVADVMGWLTFKDEPLESMQQQAPKWEKFRRLLRIACVEARHRQELEAQLYLGRKGGD